MLTRPRKRGNIESETDMTQIITGPFGRLAYHDSGSENHLGYPALNVPSCDFARAEMLVAANQSHALNVVQLPRQMRSRAALAMFGEPTKRKS